MHRYRSILCTFIFAAVVFAQDAAWTPFFSNSQGLWLVSARSFVEKDVLTAWVKTIDKDHSISIDINLKTETYAFTNDDKIKIPLQPIPPDSPQEALLLLFKQLKDVKYSVSLPNFLRVEADGTILLPLFNRNPKLSDDFQKISYLSKRSLKTKIEWWAELVRFPRMNDALLKICIPNRSKSKFKSDLGPENSVMDASGKTIPAKHVMYWKLIPIDHTVDDCIAFKVSYVQIQTN